MTESDGILNFDYFVEASKLVQKYALLSSKNQMQAFLLDRRLQLKDNMMKKYIKTVRKSQEHKKQVRSAVLATLFIALKVPHNTYVSSLKKYTAIPEFRKAYQQAIQSVEAEVMATEKKELTRDQIMDSVMFIETAKLNQFKKAFEAVSKDKSPRQLMEGLKISRVIIEDDFYNKFQLEVKQVVDNVKDQNLQEDEELKGIVQDANLKKLEFLRDSEPEHMKKMIMMERMAMKTLGLIENDDDYETEEEEEVVEGDQKVAAA